MLTRRQAIAAAVGAITAGGIGSRSGAAAIDKLAHIVVGFPAGGGTDIVARVLAQALQGAYAPAVIVEDKPGASGRLAIEYVKNAPADGSVMLFTPDFPMTLYPFSFKALAYDPIRDFVAVGPAAKGMLTFAIGPAAPASVTTLGEFMTWCKANPDKANVADTSAGGTPHFTGVMLAHAAKVALTPVHYRGGAPTIEDLVGGHVPASINPVSEVIGYAKSGQLRILAVTGARRSPFLPEVPTMQEAGYDVVVESLSGVFMPATTPHAVVEALSAALRATTQSPAVIDSLAKFGTEPAFLPPAEFAAWIKNEIARWGPVVKASGFVALE